MTKRNWILGLVAMGAVAFAAGCDDDDDDAGTGGSGLTGTGGSGGTGAAGGAGGTGGGTTNATLTLTFDGLEPLGDDFVYEGWLIVDGSPVSTGRFDVDGSPYEFEIGPMDAEDATAFVLTIEPDQGDDPAPTAVHVLAGDLSNGLADLTIGHAAALGTDFATALGSYILNTPSTASDEGDYDQGIWWLMVGANGPEVSLTLPTLPAGWVYEGWVVGPDGPISTGTFSAVDMEDSDGKGSTAGPDGTPPFPGQDFIDPAVQLAGGDFAAVISVEPDPDDSPMPFAIKPLVDDTIDDPGIGVTQNMTNAAATNAPSGTAAIEESTELWARAAARP